MKLLLITHRAPWPPDKGDRIRSYHLLRHLSKGHRVWLASLGDETPADATPAELRRLTQDVAIEPLGGARWLRAAASLASGRSATEGAFASAALRRTIDRWNRQVRFDAAIAYCSSSAQFLPADVPAFVDLTDVDSEKWLEYAARSRPPRGWLYDLEGRRVRRLEAEVGARAAMVALATLPEVELYRRFAPSANAVAIPNGVDSNYFAPANAQAEPRVCTFVGAMDYRPNIEGCEWFVRCVWPDLRTSYPDAAFRIVGRDPARRVLELARAPGVEVVGGVPDVRPWLARSSVVVAPLAIARGVQNKVLEALAMARPVVASPGAKSGLDVASGVELLVAAQPEEWIRQIALLWNDPEQGRRLGFAGREFVLARHQWDGCLSVWDDHLEGVASRAESRISVGAAQ